MTRTLAATTGAELITTPYVIHIAAPMNWTARNVRSPLQKYDATTTAVANQPIDALKIAIGSVRQLGCWP